MNNLEKFNHSVNVLLKAYLNDTLEHGNCTACAVGNLIAHELNTVPKVNVPIGDFYQYENGLAPEWQYVFVTRCKGQRQQINHGEYWGEAKRQIDLTGYTFMDLARVEYAFENCSLEGDRMFNGLMDVVDVLSEIHNIDLSIKEEAKNLFVKA